jgi:hypothetical protein
MDMRKDEIYYMEHSALLSKTDSFEMVRLQCQGIKSLN